MSRPRSRSAVRWDMPAPDRLAAPSLLCDDRRAMAGVLRTSSAHGADGPPGEPAVRLLDEHDRRVVVLKLDAVSHEATPDSAGAGSGRPARGSRRGLRVLALALILLGALALADGVVTLVWQEPFSALYAKL